MRAVEWKGVEGEDFIKYENFLFWKYGSVDALNDPFIETTKMIDKNIEIHILCALLSWQKRKNSGMG